jgi:hypothetical protein
LGSIRNEHEFQLRESEGGSWIERERQIESEREKEKESGSERETKTFEGTPIFMQFLLSSKRLNPRRTFFLGCVHRKMCKK